MKKISLLCLVIFGANLTACKEPQTATVGNPAPELAAYDLQGKSAGLKQWEGRKILLSFWSETCGACVAELRALEQTEKAYPNKIKLVAVNVDGEGVDVKKAVEKHRITQTVVQDQLKMTAERYQLIGTPTAFLIDEKGIVRQKFEGKISNTALENIFK